VGLFKVGTDGKIMTISREELSEKALEALIEKNPETILEGEPLLIIGREVSTDYGSMMDLLGITASGNTVIIELKKGMTPRDVITQILEYAVWVEKLGYEELNRIALDKVNAKSLRNLYMEFFGESGLLENIIENVNSEQLLVIVAKEISETIEDMARYLRERGINLRCLKYTYFSGESGEKYLHVDTVVGKEPMRGATAEISPIPEIYRLLDKVIEEIKSPELTAPQVYQEFGRLFPDEMSKLKERYKNTPHFSTKTYIARSLMSYTKRETAPIVLTNKTTQAPGDWGYPKVKMFRKKAT